MNNRRAMEIMNGSMQVTISFVDNKAAAEYGSGGAIMMIGNQSSIAVHQCHFMNNSARLNGGAIII